MLLRPAEGALLIDPKVHDTGRAGSRYPTSPDMPVTDRRGLGRYFLNELKRFSDDANSEIIRVALKMATGTGKTTPTGTLIAWLTLNKATNIWDNRFSDASLVECCEGNLSARPPKVPNVNM